MNNKDDEKVVNEIKEKLRTGGKITSQSGGSLDFQKPEDVKQYLDNLFTEYSFQCLSEKSPDGCHRFANFLESMRGQYKEATEIYKKNCDNEKHTRSCEQYAKNKVIGRGCKQDILEACQYSFKACDYGSIEGCLNAGICLSEEKGGLPKNLKESVKYLSMACQSNNPIACVRLFKLYIDDNSIHGLNRDPVKAFEYTRKACENNDFLGCMNASIMQRKGDGIPKNEKLAEEFKLKAEKIKSDLDSSKERQNINFGEQHR